MQNEVEEFTPVILSKMDPGITGSFGFLPGTIEARAIAIVPPGSRNHPGKQVSFQYSSCQQASLALKRPGPCGKLVENRVGSIVTGQAKDRVNHLKPAQQR